MKINNLKVEKEADIVKLETLSKTKEKLGSLEKAEINLAECCQMLKTRLDNPSYLEKREILDMLAIKVLATTEGVN